MKKIVCLIVTMVLFGSFSAYAKIIFVGSHGGVESYVNVFSNGWYADPLEGLEVDHLNGSELLELLNDIAKGENGNKYSNGVDASIALVRAKTDYEIKARVYNDGASTEDALNWTKSIYEEGDGIFLVGYSAGGKFVIKLASSLRSHGFQVQYMGLIDPVIWLSKSLIIENNVKVVDIFIQQNSGSWGMFNILQKGNAFFFYDKNKTEYHNYLVTGSDVDHLNLDNKDIVWGKIGNHMLFLLGMNPSDIESDNDIEEIALDGIAIDINELTEEERREVEEANQDSGGSDQGTDDPDDPTIYTQDEDSDLHIKDFYLAIYGTDHWEHRVEQQLYPGQSFQIEGEARIENDSGVDADDVDIDYRVDHGKNFDTDDTKLDEEDLLDIDPGEYVTKHMGRTTVSLSQDGLTVTVQGPGRSESFDVEDNFCKIYFFVDVENDDDDDISSNSDSDEYGVVEVTVIPFTPKFTANPLTATGYETIDFTDLTEGTVHTYSWNFGDGTTSNDPNPAHYYDSYGTFPVTLTVSDYTFTASTSQTITINQPDPSITITSPTKGEKWRSDKDRRIRWTWANLPYGEPIKIEYSCTGGASWRTIYDGYTTNDGKKTWKMDKSKTKDTSNGYIRILRRSNGQELGRSPRFKIDHAKGDPKW